MLYVIYRLNDKKKLINKNYSIVIRERYINRV